MKNRFGSDRIKMVVLREILLSYDQAASPDDRETALKRLKDHCNWSHDHNRPTNLKKIKKVEEAKGAEDTSEEEDPELRGYVSAFKAEEVFNKELLRDNKISTNVAADIHPVSNTHAYIIEVPPNNGLRKDEAPQAVRELLLGLESHRLLKQIV